MDECTLVSTRDVLERWRGSYAETAQSDSWPAAHQWGYGVDVALATARDVREKLRLCPQDRILEVGAGSGAFLAAVMHEGQSGVAFDFCDEQVRASDKFGVNKSFVKLGVAEAARIPLRSSSFDKVLCYSVAHYFPDDRYLQDSMQEMLRVCRPGGLVLLGDVAGIMERSRKGLVRAGVPVGVADAILWLTLPVRSLYRACTRKRAREARFFRRPFLERVLRGMPCNYEFLDQDIPGRPASRCRFDIRMIKKN
jgi:ubiquinone/menaquinone biosynthesis C-methylase UbiE